MKRPVLCALACAVLALGSPRLVVSEELEERLARQLAALLSIYEHLHAHPELSQREEQTAQVLARELRRLGFEVTEHVGDHRPPARVAHGVVGVLRNGRGPTVMLRTDLDALPVEEKTGLPYASHVKAKVQGGEVGVMHACGHDLHMTAWLGTARLLAELRGRWSGTLVLVGQPAEEEGAGAEEVLQAGLYRRFPRPSYVLAYHVMPTLAAGQVGHREGPMLASSDSVDLTIRGAGGHGALPHLAKDPIVIASQVVLALQTIVSRELSPLDSAVVTVGSFQAGTRPNVIPEEARLKLTVRAYQPETRQHILASIARIARGVALAAGVPEHRLPLMRVDERDYTPSTHNDPALVRRLVPVLERTLGLKNVVASEPVMAAEDFARYGLTTPRVPCALFWLGTTDPLQLAAAHKGIALPSIHSSQYAPAVRPALQAGIKAMAAMVLELLRR